MIHRQSRQHGQALVETTMVLGLLLLLLNGVFATGTLASDQNTATTAVRSGGRFAAELGSNGWQTGNPTDPTTVDASIVREACRIAATMPYATLVDVLIYKPGGNADGTYKPASDPSNTYKLDQACNITAGMSPRITSGSCGSGPGYGLDCRVQTDPTEASLGLQLDYVYQSPTAFYSLTMNESAYTVVVLAPVFS